MAALRELYGRRRSHRADDHLGLGHRVGAALRLHARLRRHRSAHARAWTPTRFWRRITSADASRLSHARPGLQRPDAARCSTNWSAAASRSSRTSASRTARRSRADGSARSASRRTSRSTTPTISARSKAAWSAPTTPISTRRCACCARTAWSASWTRRAESTSIGDEYPDLNPDFIFAYPGLQRAQHRDQRGHRPVATQPARREQSTSERRTCDCSSTISTRTSIRPTSPSRGAATTPSRWSCGSRDASLCDRVMQALRRTASSSAAARRAAATRCGSRTCGRSWAASVEAIPERGSCPFLRHVHRQLPEARARKILRLCELLNELAATN